MFKNKKNAAPAAAGAEKPKKNVRARLLVAGVVVLLVAATVVVLLNTRLKGVGKVIDDEWKTPSYLSGKTMNILVCGVDTDADRQNNPEAQGSDATLNTDVILLVNLDMEADKATILQIPRDTYVGTNIVDYGKINGLYGRGYVDNVPAGYTKGLKGMAALIETINYQFRLPVDNYVLVTMEGFRTAVDMLGGVEVTLDKQLKFDITGPDGATVVDTVTLDPGTHTLNGEMAEVFVRYRDSNGDLGRMDVQRYFMAALLNKALTLSTGQLASLVNAVMPYLETDFTVSEMISLGMEAKKYSMDSISTVSVPGEGVYPYTRWNLDVWSVHQQALADLLNKYMRPYSDDVPSEDLNVVEIRNTKDDYTYSSDSLSDYS
ncbi:MAG: LCP family protein [Oscillospiraceae bacterium]|nr:LCP family protein [Oscillospiraceae bacterium]